MRDVAYFLNNTKEVGECKEWLGALNADGYPLCLGKVTGMGSCIGLSLNSPQVNHLKGSW